MGVIDDLKSRWRTVAAALVLGGAAIQAVPVDRTNPPVLFEVIAPADVMKVLETSCYDCHSNETEWPWYSRVAPVSWLVARDVRRGRADLNFSEWPSLDPEVEAYQKSLVADEVEAGRMPLAPYRLLHRDAELTDDERATLLEWAREPAWGLDPGPGW